jgi:hypothetical protein
MDGTLYWRYRRGGGDVALPAWESSPGLESWGDAPAPALVAKRFLDRVLKTLWDDLSLHLVFGTATAAAFCLLTRGGSG